MEEREKIETKEEKKIENRIFRLLRSEELKVTEIEIPLYFVLFLEKDAKAHVFSYNIKNKGNPIVYRGTSPAQYNLDITEKNIFSNYGKKLETSSIGILLCPENYINKLVFNLDDQPFINCIQQQTLIQNRYPSYIDDCIKNNFEELCDIQLSKYSQQTIQCHELGRTDFNKKDLNEAVRPTLNRKQRRKEDKKKRALGRAKMRKYTKSGRK